MNQARLASPDVAQMQGACALPRKSGEIVFHHEWERRAFAIAVSLAERGEYPWREFQHQLIAAIAEAERQDPQHPTRGYFESWLVSLESVLRTRGLVSGPLE